MKKTILIIFILLGVQQFSNAQNNVIGLHLQPLAFGELRGSFEHAFTDKVSGILNFGYKIPGEIPEFILEQTKPTDYGLPVSAINEISGYQFVPEFRIYFKDNNEPQGLYISPYLRYAKYSISYSDKVDYEFTTTEYNDLPQDVVDYMETNNLGNTLGVNVETKGDFSQMGVGLQLGYQWIIAERLAIDFYFLGLEVDMIEFNAETYSPDANNLGIDYRRWEDDIQEAINFTEDVPFIDIDVEVEVLSDKVSGKANSIAPWYRGGIKIGFAF